MKRNPLIDESFARYSTHKSDSWILGLVCGFFMAAVLALGIIAPSVQFWLVPLLILPFFFACIVSHMGFEFNQPLTFGSHFRYFRAYFSPVYWSAFSFFRSLLKALIAFFVAVIITSAIGVAIMRQVDWDGFSDALSQFEEYYTQATTISMQEILDIMALHDSILYRYATISLVPALDIAVLVFFYFASKSSISVYARSSFTNIDPRLMKVVIQRTLYKERKRYFRNYWALNWPLLAALAAGLVIGDAAYSFVSFDTSTLFSVGLVAGFFFTSFLWPFYFNNMEVIFKDMKDSFLDTSDEVKNELLKTLDQNVAIAKEQRERMEDVINGFSSRRDDDEGNDEENEDGQ